MVLTRYKEHDSLLSERIQEYADKIFLLSGDKSKKELQKIREQMEGFSAGETMILAATGQMVGEEFDYPRLDTLILATPISWKGIVEQYAGAIYDFENYLKVFERDLQEAEKDILISSPQMNRKKVYRMISLLKERQEAGVKVTVVTWHPDC